jgi:hypothetical protein
MKSIWTWYIIFEAEPINFKLITSGWNKLFDLYWILSIHNH